MPDIGYPDFQRVVNWDSPVLYSGSVNNETTYVQSGALDVSRYAYMGGYMQCYVGYCLVTLEWFLDQAMTTIVGQREFVLDQHIANLCQPKIAHMGPFLQVTFEAVSNAPFTADWSLFATNRASSLEFAPVNSAAMSIVNDNIGANSSKTVYPSDYVNGAAHVHAFMSQSGIAQLQYVDLSATGQTYQNIPITANEAVDLDVILPTGTWWIVVTNQSASAANYYMIVLPSTTGSS